MANLLVCKCYDTYGEVLGHLCTGIMIPLVSCYDIWRGVMTHLERCYNTSGEVLCLLGVLTPFTAQKLDYPTPMDRYIDVLALYDASNNMNASFRPYFFSYLDHNKQLMACQSKPNCDRFNNFLIQHVYCQG